MNREIKFRAWDGKKMVDTGMMHDTTCGGYEMWDGENHEYYPVMQYTGLRDKNGKEIYEGDIVKFYDTNMPDEDEFNRATPMECRFQDNGFGFYGMGDSRTGAISNIDKEYREIIGNIYENPELLDK